jgi:hypothetical protein
MEKKCSKCEISKPLDKFPNDPRCSGGKRGACKACRVNQWVPEENQTLTCKICTEKHHTLFANHGKQKPYECKACRNKRDFDKRNLDRDAYNKNKREVYQKTKDKINETRRKTLQRRRNEDPKYRAMMALHCRLYMAVKEKTGKTMELTGCSKEELTTFLEAEFTEGMTWENYGTWHIDHIRPCASFNLEDPGEQKRCFHWTNLQPLWAIDNIRKGANYSKHSVAGLPAWPSIYPAI